MQDGLLELSTKAEKAIDALFHVSREVGLASRQIARIKLLLANQELAKSQTKAAAKATAKATAKA